MKKRIIVRLIVVLVLASLISGCGNKDQEQSDSGNNEQEQVDSEESEESQLVGGFTEMREVTEDDLAVFNAALSVEEQQKYSPQKVATQVVAGTNFNFECVVINNSEGTEEIVNIIIFKPLDENEAPTVTEIIPKAQ